MAGQVRTRGGAVLLQRLGPLRMGEQSRWGRAPTSRGLWAFPWPLFEMFFAYHQYADAAPVRLRTDRGQPVHRSAFVDVAGNPPPGDIDIDALRESVRSDGPYRIRDGFNAEREEWIRTVGRRTVRRHQFWFAGDLYTHLTPRGDVLGIDEWRLMPATTFAEAVRRSGADVVTYRQGDQLIRQHANVDHLEVFVAAGSGQLTGRSNRRPTPTPLRRR